MEFNTFSMAIQAVISAVVSAAVSGGIGFYFKKKFKIFADRIERSALEHQIKFSKLHELRAIAIFETYDSAQTAVESLPDILRSDPETEEETRRTAWGNYHLFRKKYTRSRIYFAKDVVDKLEELDSKLFEILMTFDSFFSRREPINTAVGRGDINEVLNLSKVLLPQIEQEARKLFGVG